VDVVGQPVEQRAGGALGAERLGPFVERQVAGDQRGTSFVALGDKFEQEFRAGLAEGDEAQFVDVEEGPWPRWGRVSPTTAACG